MAGKTGDLYSLLGVPASATLDEIKAAYRQAARRFHPDVNPAPAATEEFKLIASAYAVLSDPAQRQAYDATLARMGSGPLLNLRMLFSRQVLPPLDEPQVLYALLDVSPTVAPAATLTAPPINLCIVVDRSTSMQGARLDQVKTAVLEVIDNLRDNDAFSVVAFSDRAEVIVPAQRDWSERTLARAKVSTIHAQGGTEMLQGLLYGLTELHREFDPAGVNHLILLTDGQTYGDEEDCLLLAQLAATDGITLSGLGIGEEWNDKFLDELTSLTGGTSAYISTPPQVQAFIRDRVRSLSAAYAERLALQVTPDSGVQILTAFRVAPEAGPLPVDEMPLRLGSLPRQQTLSFLLKFLIPPVTEGPRPVARLALYADVIGLGRRGERTTADITLNVAQPPAPAPPPPAAIIDALSKLSQYRLQERAWQEAASGDIVSASRHLSTLGTRLLASGQTDLARAALTEARRLEKTQLLSEEAKKNLKYGTRALIPPGARTEERKQP